MKTKHLFMTFGVALAMGMAAMSSCAVREATSVSAEPEATYYLTGEINGEDHWGDYIAAPASGTNLGELHNQELHAGDLFKFKLKDTWDNSLGWWQMNTAAGAYDCFNLQHGAGGGAPNIYCGANGIYNFYIYQDGADVKISVEFAEANTATYSYFVVLNSDFNKLHAWMDNGQVLRAWDSDIMNFGQAYDAKLVYDEAENYGIYRVDDRILNGWQNIILLNDTNETVALHRTKGNTQEVYFYGDTAENCKTFAKTSNEYKAVEFLYDVLSHRGAATYELHDFAYSICATSVEDASALVARYTAFAAGVKAILANASVQTYDLSGDWSEDNKTFRSIEDVVAALTMIAARDTATVGNYSLLENGENSIPAMIIIIASVMLLSVATVTTVIVLKKTRFHK